MDAATAPKVKAKAANAADASGEELSLGVFQGTVRAILLVKMKTLWKSATIKSFNPGKVSMFQELRVL